MEGDVREFLNKEMSRKEFLGIVGLGLCSLFGIGTAVRMLTGKSFSSHIRTTADYNGGLYGGRKRQNP